MQVLDGMHEAPQRVKIGSYDADDEGLDPPLRPLLLVTTTMTNRPLSE